MIEDASTMDGDAPPIPLDNLAGKVDFLDVMAVAELSEGQVYAAWVRRESGLDAARIARALAEPYRAAARARPALKSDAGSPDPLPPVMTIEAYERIAIIQRVRGFLAIYLFDPASPLGMARLSARRLSTLVAAELPLAPEAKRTAVPDSEPPPEGEGDRATLISPQPSPPPDPDREVETLAFDRAPHGRDRLPTLNEVDRAGRLLEYLHDVAPEPHIVKLRVALRAGLSLAALDHPDSLGADAIVLIETAVEDILGIDRAELRGIT